MSFPDLNRWFSRTSVALWLLLLPLGIAAAQSPTYIGVRAPSETERRRIDADFSRQYADQIASPGPSPLARLELAQRILRAADEHRNVPGEYFVWKLHAAEMFARAGQWRDALHLCDELSGEFTAPFASTRALVVREICTQQVSSKPCEGLIDAVALRLVYDTIEGCLAEDAFYPASVLLVPAEELEKRLSLSGPQALSAAYLKLIGENQGFLPFIKHDQLAANPLNPQANHAWGEYYCCTKGDFETGLPHLALSFDAALQDLARRDLTRPVTANEINQLVQDYVAVANKATKPHAKAAWESRAAYWRAQAMVQQLSNNPGQWNNTPVLNANPQASVVRSTWQPGSSAAKQQRPYGASLLLTFRDNAVQRAGGAPFNLTLPGGRTLFGNRAVLVDASPRANHVEAMAVVGGTARFIEGAWNSRGAPMVLPQRLAGNLSGYTLSAWVRFDYGNDTGLLLSEPAKPNTDTPNDAIHWSIDAQRQIDLRQVYPAVADATGKLLKPTRIRTSPLDAGRWNYIAITVLPGQHLRLNINGQTIQSPLRPSVGSKDGLALLGAISGQIDEVAFYPRPLSPGEVEALFHMGLAGISLASADLYMEFPQPIKLPPVIYRSPNEPLAGDPNPNPNNPSPSVDPNPAVPPKPIASNKRPKPSVEELKEGKKLVQDLFAKDLEKADTTDQKQALARKLQSVAKTTDDSMPARYMLFQEAAELLTSCDSLEAWDAWEQLANEFDTSVVEEKADLLDRLQKKAKVASDHKILAHRYIGLLNEALQEDDYRVAGVLTNKAEVCVKKSGDKVLDRMVQLGTKDLKQMKAAFTAVDAAKKKFAESPTDKAAAYDWGRYLCLYRGNFDQGLPILASAGDQPLAVLARQDATRPSGHALQTELADAWWKEADGTDDDRSRKMLRSRATYWYRQALPSTTGVVAAKLRKRVDDYMAEISPIPLKEAFDALSMVDVNVHGTVGRWGRQGAVVAVIPDQRGSRLKIPVAINGSYDFQMRIDWQGRFSNTEGLLLQLPIGNSRAEVAIGRSPELSLIGTATSRAKIDMPSLSLDQGKIYIVAASVEADGDQATLKVLMNNRPYLSWTGPISDLDVTAELRLGGGFGDPRDRFGRPLPVAQRALQPTIEIFGFSSIDAYAVSALQLKINSGWAEPLQ